MAKAKTSTKAAKNPEKRIVQTLNVNAPGKTYPRDADKYEAARKVFLKVMPKSGAGVTQAEMMALDQTRWDQQIEADSNKGKLDFLINAALAEHQAGKSKPL